MKYIRTKDGRIGISWEIASKPNIISFGQPHKFRQEISKDNIFKQADTIEELCDTKVAIRKSNHKAYLGHFYGTFMFQEDSGWLGRLDSYEIIYGAIWTGKGLIYVAKINDKGELELL